MCTANSAGTAVKVLDLLFYERKPKELLYDTRLFDSRKVLLLGMEVLPL